MHRKKRFIYIDKSDIGEQVKRPLSKTLLAPRSYIVGGPLQTHTENQNPRKTLMMILVLIIKLSISLITGF